MFCLCENELLLVEERKESNERTASHVHFQALVELITLLYDGNTPQLQAYAEQFTESKFVNVLFSIDVVAKANLTSETFKSKENRRTEIC